MPRLYGNSSSAGVRLELIALIAIIAGCMGDGKSTDDSSDATIEGDVPQDCLDYLACAAVMDPDNLELYDEAVGAEAVCWSDDQEALTCVQTCQAGLETWASSNPTVEQCWQGDSPNTLYLFTPPRYYRLSPEQDCWISEGDVTFSAPSSGQAFLIESEWHENGSPWDRSTTYIDNLSCTLEGYAFVCEAFTSNPITYALSGEFVSGFQGGSLLVEGTWNDEAYPCPTTMEFVP